MNKFLITLACVLMCMLGTENLEAQTLNEQQLSIITKKTATWCPICGRDAWDSFFQMIDDNEGKAISIAAHFSSSSELYSETAEAVVEAFEFVPGQPVFYFNEVKVLGQGQPTVDDIQERVATAFEQAASVQAGVNAYYLDGKLEVSYATRFMEATSGDYLIGFYPIYKEVVARQASLGGSATHKQILGEELYSSFEDSDDKYFGTTLASGDISAAAEYGQRTEFTMPEFATDVENNNLQLAVIIWKKLAGDYEYVNAAVTDVIMGSSALGSINEELSDLQIIPTATGASVVTLTTKQSLENAKLSIYSIDGQLLENTYTGNLTTGTHQFDFKGEAGIYVAHLLVNGKQLTKKFVVQ